MWHFVAMKSFLLHYTLLVLHYETKTRMYCRPDRSINPCDPGRSWPKWSDQIIRSYVRSCRSRYFYIFLYVTLVSWWPVTNYDTFRLKNNNLGVVHKKNYIILYVFNKHNIIKKYNKIPNIVKFFHKPFAKYQYYRCLTQAGVIFRAYFITLILVCTLTNTHNTSKSRFNLQNDLIMDTAEVWLFDTAAVSDRWDFRCNSGSNGL